MNNLFILAEIAPAPVETSGPLVDVSNMVNDFWDIITTLPWMVALLIISVGIVYMLYGWRIFRVLVTISFGFLGLFLGMVAGQYLGSIFLGGVIGMALFAFVSVPLMKWCVSILGAIAGGVITSGLWVACGLSDLYLPAGFVVGFVAGGLISFILLKASVMLFTSLGGSIIMVTGILSLWYQYEVRVLERAETQLHYLIFSYNWFLPVVLIVPTVIGIIFQNKFIKHSPKWEVE
jgi:hypothetical protein